MNIDGEAIGINLFIGKRPNTAFGNSGGDAQMLGWTQAGDGARLMMLVRHDDAKREYAYGPAGGLPDTHVGTFSDALCILQAGYRYMSVNCRPQSTLVYNVAQSGLALGATINLK
jgi:hypothetical protein